MFDFEITHSDYTNIEEDDSGNERHIESGELDFSESELEMGDDYIADALAILQKFSDQPNSLTEIVEMKTSSEKTSQNDASADVLSHPGYLKLIERNKKLQARLKTITDDFRQKLETRENDLKEAVNTARMFRQSCNELRKKVETTQEEVEENKRKWQETVSAYINYQKHSRKKLTEMVELEKINMLRQFLPVVDNLRRPLAYDEPTQSIMEGVKLTFKSCEDFLKNMDVRQISAAGNPFDPHAHEAIERIPSDAIPENTVIEELQIGYYLGDKVLRPSKVSVSYRMGQASDKSRKVEMPDGPENENLPESAEASERNISINDGKKDFIPIESEIIEESPTDVSVDDTFADDMDPCEDDGNREE